MSTEHPASGDPAPAENPDAETPPGDPESGFSGDQSPRDRFVSESQRKTGAMSERAPEETLWEGGYSPKTMLGSWIGLVVLSVAALILAGIFATAMLIWVVPALVVLWAIVGLLYASRRMGVHYQLTNRRFVHQRGILARRTDRIEVIDVDDVSYQQGPLQRIFGVGTIQICSSDTTDPELILHGIADVDHVAGLIDDVRRQERDRRALHIESI